MKILLYIFLFLLPVSSQTITEVRTMYLEASSSKVKAEGFYETIIKSKSSKPVMDVYKGAALTLKSKYAKAIKDKKIFFKAGALKIEQTIKLHPKNIEMRLIRLSIQENVPKFLKYNSSIESDKKFVKQNYRYQSVDLQKFIRGYVMQSKGFTEEEKELFK